MDGKSACGRGPHRQELGNACPRCGEPHDWVYGSFNAWIESHAKKCPHRQEGDDVIATRWRVGSKVGRTIYAEIPGTEHDAHPLIGMMDTPALAEEVVKAHNLLVDTVAAWEAQGDVT